ncbi:MAG TPA: DUF2207 domain-containing protein [Candidatus Babeliales bacterium]|nr:DUF2207 domain-containing protein [Candidatus Babeliales bacterium]
MSIKHLFIFLISFCSVYSYGQHEQILSFHADITINPNATIDVVETISVWSTGNQIKRGITREFPTRYKDLFGNNVIITFTLKSVYKEGQPIAYALNNKYNGIIIDCGDETFIKKGQHTYTISYNVNRQIGFYQDYDELAWNLIGHNSDLPVAHASARINFPPNISLNDVETDGFTGQMGSKEKYFSVEKETHSALFTITTPLGPSQGCTIVAVWPKGLIDAPTWQTLWWYFFADNLFLLWALIGWVLLCFFAIRQWLKIRRLQQQEVIIPLFYPPDNISAGAARYIMKKNLDAKGFSAEIVDLAVHGLLTIEYTATDSYMLIKNTDTSNNHQHKLLCSLFPKKNRLHVKTQNSIVQASISKLEDTFKQRFSALFSYDASFVIHTGIAAAIGISVPLFMQFHMLLPYALPLILCIVFVLFHFLHKAATLYSPAGRKTNAELLGFKMFLETTEGERIKIIGTPPTKTPELYEQYLPYAIAFGVEKAWSKQFAPLFTKLEQECTPYRPIWCYNRSLDHFNTQAFVSTFSSSFNSAISASINPPGSKSSFGGRGSSGGGGGFSGSGGGGGRVGGR